MQLQALQEDLTLEEQLEELQKEVFQLRSAEREKELALVAYNEQRQRADMLEAERDLARMEKQQLMRDAEELRKLKKRYASIMAICAAPNERFKSPYEKLAMITGPEQKPYPASLHGGSPEQMLTSIKQWNKAIGGNDENTHCLGRALKELEASGSIERTAIDTGDGRTHYYVKINEHHLDHPRFINPDVIRPHNGGDKRCPQCHQYCKKKLVISYECENCGIDYDKNMNPIDHTESIIDIPQEPQEELVLTQSELDVFDFSKKRKRS